MSQPSTLRPARGRPPVDATPLTPTEQVAALAPVMAIIEAMVLSAGDVNSLYWKLIVATRRLEAQDRRDAAAHIRAFMLEVEELVRSGRLGREDGDLLIRHASSLAGKLAMEPSAYTASDLGGSDPGSPSLELDGEDEPPLREPAEPPVRPNFVLTPRTPFGIRFARFRAVRWAMWWLRRSR